MATDQAMRMFVLRQLLLNALPGAHSTQNRLWWIYANPAYINTLAAIDERPAVGPDTAGFALLQ